MQRNEPALTRYNVTLSWVAWGLLAAWALAAVLMAGYAFAVRAFNVHYLSEDASWHLPLPESAGLSLWVIWLMATIQFAPAGLLVGLISVSRQRAARPMRVIVLTLAVVGGAAVEMVAPSLPQGDADPGQSFVHDGRLAALLVIIVALLQLGTTFWVLPHLQRRLRAAEG